MLTSFVTTCCLLAALAPQQREPPAIAAIKREFKALQGRLPRAQQQQRSVLGLSSEGASVTAFRLDGKLRKIQVEALGEMGKQLADYYFRPNGELFFVFTQTIAYDRHIMEALDGKSLKETVAESHRFYFARGELLRALRDHKAMDTQDQAVIQQASQVRAEARSFLRLMQKPAPAGGEDSCDWSCAKKKDGMVCIWAACVAR